MGSSWSRHKGPVLAQLFISPNDTYALGDWEKEIDEAVLQALKDIMGAQIITYYKPFAWNVSLLPQKTVQRGILTVTCALLDHEFLIKETHSFYGNHYKIYRQKKS